MLIAGLQKLSLLDYPGAPCAVVFTPFCNMNCAYCHNEQILPKGTPLIPQEQVLDFLRQRKGLIPALVVSGGEPTLQKDLPRFLQTARDLGYKTKLDTNGLKPNTLRALLKGGLLDYVAMDIKGPLHKYNEITRTHCDTGAIIKSIFYLRNSNVPHEFRTTFAPQLTKEDILQAAQLIVGTDKYYLQQYRTRRESDPSPHPPAYLRETAQAVRDAGIVCEERGI
ncbi:MAG: anaerobic ribonucleoside-triphosphate reductase activating protein [Clostridiales bacterium]|nr:anaerobic ribonucleoside-triphosphate reductase activating protein [Clostridiales bacterium]